MKMQEIEKWLQDYLRGEGNNIGLADGLLLEKRYYVGPVDWNIDALERCCGPESTMKYRTDEKDFNKRINGITERILQGWEMPPLLVSYERNEFLINDGNHRYEAYKKLNKKIIPVIFWMTKNEDYLDFMELTERKNKLTTAST